MKQRGRLIGLVLLGLLSLYSGSSLVDFLLPDEEAVAVVPQQQRARQEKPSFKPSPPSRSPTKRKKNAFAITAKPTSQKTEDVSTNSLPPQSAYYRTNTVDKSATFVCVIAQNQRQRSLFSRNIPYLAGSGAFSYVVVKPTPCQYQGTCRNADKARHPLCHPSMPTLFVNSHMRCCGVSRFRKCQTMLSKGLFDLGVITGDEYCEVKRGASGKTSHAFRQYFDSSLTRRFSTYFSSSLDKAASARETSLNLPHFLPLGPRYEFDRVEQAFSPASLREVFFNFMGSATSPIRLDLAKTIETFREANPSMKHKLQIASKWTTKIRPGEGYVMPGEYRRILLDTVFTLCPIGHNPEAYRIYEAIEAGSIPVLSLDLDQPKGACENAFHPFVDSHSPIPMLRNWKELPAFLLDAQSRPKGYLDSLQTNVTSWYKGFMHKFALELEAQVKEKWELRLRQSQISTGMR